MAGIPSGGESSELGKSAAQNSDGGGSVTGSAERGSENTRTVHYENGDAYEGELKDDKPHGKGVYTFASGGVYDGEFKEGEKHGSGTYNWGDGEVYEGQYANGKRHGRGVYRHADGTVYDGEWRDDLRHGSGINSLTNGGVYDGQWVEGKHQGLGTLTCTNGDVYKGEFEGGQRHGWGTMEYTSGNVYEGQWVAGKKHGNGGTMMFKSGKTFEGEFKEGKLHGKCTLKYSSGDIYEGVWTDGEMEGKGTMKWANGDIQTGHFDRPGGCKLRSTRSQQRRLEADKRVCEHCGVDDFRYKLRVCSGCNLALYCSLDCQKAASRSHRRICDIISELPPRDADRLILEFDREYKNDFDAGLRYATKYMYNLKHLKIDAEDMVSGDALKISAKTLSSLLRSKREDLHSFFWIPNLNSIIEVPGITRNGHAMWKELRDLKQLYLQAVKFDELHPLHDVIGQQKDTLLVLGLPTLEIDWSKAKTRRAAALAVSACKQLVKLDLLTGWLLMDPDLKVMLSHLPDLRILRLTRFPSRNSHEFTDNTCGLIARKCPGLQELNLGWHNQLSVRGIRKIFEGCPHLRAFYTTTLKLSCKDVQSLLANAPQLLFLSLDGGINFSTGELDEIIEATGGRTVFAFGLLDTFYDPEGDALSANTREKYDRQIDVLNEIWTLDPQGDPDIANEWAGMFEGYIT